jgi:hypothetical protein
LTFCSACGLGISRSFGSSGHTAIAVATDAIAVPILITASRP